LGQKTLSLELEKDADGKLTEANMAALLSEHIPDIGAIPTTPS